MEPHSVQTIVVLFDRITMSTHWHTHPICRNITMFELNNGKNYYWKRNNYMPMIKINSLDWIYAQLFHCQKLTVNSDNLTMKSIFPIWTLNLNRHTSPPFLTASQKPGRIYAAKTQSLSLCTGKMLCIWMNFRKSRAKPIIITTINESTVRQ